MQIGKRGLWCCSQCRYTMTPAECEVVKYSSMPEPWCSACIEKENELLVKERNPEAPQGFFHRLPRYLQEIQ